MRTGRLGAAVGATGGGGDGGARSVVSAAIRLVDLDWRCLQSGPRHRIEPGGRASSICLSAMESKAVGLVGGSGGLLFSCSPAGGSGRQLLFSASNGAVPLRENVSIVARLPISGEYMRVL